jgi:hypothetical protein
MNKTVFLTFSDIDESSINAWQNILNSAEVNISDLVATLSNDQLIYSLICEQCCDPQLLRDDNLLGHGKEIESPAGLRTDQWPTGTLHRVEN